MTTLPAAGYGSDTTRSESEMQTYLENFDSVFREILGGGPEQTATLATQTFTPLNNWGPAVMLDTQGGISSDNLKNIAATNCRDGHVVLVRITSSARVIVVTNANGGAGQILTADGANFTLTDPKQWVILKYKSSSTSWEELVRSQNIDAFPIAGATANTIMAGPTSGGAAKPTLRAMVTADLGTLLNQLLGWLPRTTLTVLTNVITPTRAVHQVDNSGAAQTVNSIAQSNTPDGTILIVSPTNTSSTNTLTLAHNAGGAANPILLTGAVNVVMSLSTQALVLLRTGSSWTELGRLGFAASGAIQGICQGRLTLSTGVPVTISDQVGLGTLYFTPYKGNQVATYSGSAWTLNTFTEKSISLATIIKWLNYDVFLVDGSLVLELLAWKQLTATSNITGGTTVTVNVTDTTGVVNGDVHTISNSTYSTQELAIVASFVTNTSITYVTAPANSYTSPIINYNARATALVTQDGVNVKSGSTNRLFLGTIRATAGNGTSGGTCEDSKQRRFCVNAFNYEIRSLGYRDPAASWTYTLNTWRQSNNSSSSRCEFLIPIAGPSIVNLRFIQEGVNGTAALQYAGIGVDTVTTPTIASGFNTSGSGNFINICEYSDVLAAGYHFATMMEKTGAGTATIFGTQSGDRNSTLLGTIEG